MTESKGTYRCYVERKFTPDVQRVIQQANTIIEKYEPMGLSLTLRQLYYQFVSLGLLPNNQREYDRLGRIISDARLAGLVSWTALEDRGRNLQGYRTFDSPAQSFRAATREYKIDRWANQLWRPEVWVEKQAMEGVIGSACSKLRVDFFATKGYNSQSEQWRAGQRMAQYVQKGQRPVIFHLADHDPSGFDMTDDLTSRIELFAGVPIMVVRLALNSEQVHKYSPPPNPAKETDSRFGKYKHEHGTDSSWELDALEPGVISKIIEEAILSFRDPKLWDELTEQETDDRRVMEVMVEELGGKVAEEGEDYE